MTITNPFDINNEGVGKVELTMAVDTTSAKDFTQTDLDAGYNACVVSDDNEAGMGSSGDKLFGKVTGVSDDLDANDIPKTCTVQVGGVAKFTLGTGTAPTVGQMVEVDGAGRVNVAAADADIAAGGHLARGQVIAVDATNAWVWL